MNEHEILTWLAASALGEAVRSKAWLFPTLEILHFLGLCMLMGALLVLDLRLLGIARRVPIGPATRYIPIAAAGFAICAITGIGFISSDPFNYASNWSFKLKLVLVLIAGLNALAFEILERRKIMMQAPDGETSTRAKCIAGLSLGLWFAVLCLGRLLPYLGGRGG
jgi:hypothetical protein